MNDGKRVTDFYEHTMSNVYYKTGKGNIKVYFDAFFRTIPFGGGYALMGGVDEIIKFVENLKFNDKDIEHLKKQNKFDDGYLEYLKNFKFTGDIKIVPDGTPVFPNEPIMTVRANLIEAQLIETAILSYLNSSIKFTTGAKQIVDAALDIPVMEFGPRRSDNPFLATKCSYIAGCVGTANTEAGAQYGIPVMGTMAHSFIMGYDSEYDAFLDYAKVYPNDAVFLVDTYDTLNSGVKNAIKVAYDYLIPNGYRLKGIRIDSGDLAYLSKKARIMLDEAGLTDAKICLSNGLDAKTIKSLIEQGAKVDSLGVGDNISAPKERVGVVYKLVGMEEDDKIIPKIKVSDTQEKTINPGVKKLYRLYDKKTGFALADVIGTCDEKIDENKYTLIDPYNRLNTKDVENYIVRQLQVDLFKNGKLVYQDMSLNEKRDYCKKEVDKLYEEVRRLENPAKYYVDLTEDLLNLKESLVKKHKGRVKKYA